MGFPVVDRRITSPTELEAILRDIKRGVADGSLRQIRREEALLAVEELIAVPDEGPWPDYLEAHFEDRTGARYKLSVETYHGAGGSWRKL
jgi:hypothetical protein